MILSYKKHILQFKKPAGTSRGVYTTREVYILTVQEKNNPQKAGYGECAPLPDLSCDALPDFEDILKRVCENFDGTIPTDFLRNYPSILFGIETALKDFQSTQTNILWESNFTKGTAGIPINGLIWMGSYNSMKEQIKEKLEKGFRCIKLKIGAIDFEEEYALLKKIRREYDASEITLRVDANGAFSSEVALEKLERLSRLNIHSIEQPIRANQWEEMASLCKKTPLPIALDEELIGVNDIDRKSELLDFIAPQFIILKPTLHGGIMGATEWIELAKKRNIGYWITSALESNVGLNAIAQWCATLNLSSHQGLGTGALFVENFPTPLFIEGEQLWFKAE